MVKDGPKEVVYTPQEIAKRLGLNPNTVREAFRRLPGVILFGGRRKRLRVPERVFLAWLEEHKVKGEG